MGKGTLTICSASAGSGKTYKLTGIYLTRLFISRYNYRRILAVTFTHKATAEMKSRILDNLNMLAIGGKSDYLPLLIAATSKREEWIRAEAKEILNSILHDFSRFSVSTIDSFFQKILRAFTREVGLHSGFNIELDHSIILSSAVDNMIASASTDDQLKDWLKTYAMSNIEEEKSWNLREAIIKLSEELFKESFKILSADERSKLEDKNFLLEYKNRIRSFSTAFEKQIIEFGSRADELFSEFGLSDDMFYGKGKGVPGFIRSMVSGTVKEPGSYVRAIENEPPRWATGATSRQLQAAINSGLEKVLRDAIHFYDAGSVSYRSSKVVLSNIYALGILTDVLHNVHLITSSENSFLLSDTGEMLNLVTNGSQSPFIYEKVGNRYENFMIDEFQDTSIMQWKNFWPLIENSMAEGFDNLVVGDVKQSIYRWRNSDWHILGSVLPKKIDNDRFISDSLTINRRSRSNIIRFNNSLFSAIPEYIDQTISSDADIVSFKELYSEAVQDDPGNCPGGYVRLEFVEDDKEIRWQEKVMAKLPEVIESVQKKGYRASDIGIIVRDGREGALVLKTLIDYNNKSSEEMKQTYNYSVVSNDSLLLSNSPVIKFIIAVIAVVNNPQDMISRALMLRFFLLARGDEESDKAPLISSKLIEASRYYFPEGYEAFLNNIRQMSLFEATESIIKFFCLGEYSWNVAYLNTFQDHILSFSGSKNSDIQSFLDWWEENQTRKSVVLPGNQDAIRIMTIHKAKGLEFKVVILPFLSWNLDHLSSKQPFLWVRPESPPFNDLGIIPVKYSKELLGTIFRDYYNEEKSSVYLDNINLLYVALTRAKEVIYAFSVDNPRLGNSIAGVLKNGLTLNQNVSGPLLLNLCSYYKSEERLFELGEISENKKEESDNTGLTPFRYPVNRDMKSLKLKLHGENYFSSDKIELRKKINYGKLMHEIFEGIKTPSDISVAIRKLVLEGKLPEEESAEIEERVISLVNDPKVADWFIPDNEVMAEAGILMPNGITRRPDRVIFRDGKTIIVDFKFGEENPHYLEQVEHYRELLLDMGHDNIEAFIWYVDKNKIVSA